MKKYKKVIPFALEYFKERMEMINDLIRKYKQMQKTIINRFSSSMEKSKLGVHLK